MPETQVEGYNRDDCFVGLVLERGLDRFASPTIRAELAASVIEQHGAAVVHLRLHGDALLVVLFFGAAARAAQRPTDSGDDAWCKHQ
jgi:hypothetical protein